MKHTAAFTLIELLIVISIIAILSGIAIAVINPTSMHARARDARRLSDISNIMNAVERYGIDTDNYPDDLNVVRVSNILPEGQFGPLESTKNGWIKADFSLIASLIPSDPLNKGESVYKYTHTKNTYEIDCLMEYYKDKALGDGGNNDNRFEVGNDTTLLD